MSVAARAAAATMRIDVAGAVAAVLRAVGGVEIVVDVVVGPPRTRRPCRMPPARMRPSWRVLGAAEPGGGAPVVGADVEVRRRGGRPRSVTHRRSVAMTRRQRGKLQFVARPRSWPCFRRVVPTSSSTASRRTSGTNPSAGATPRSDRSSRPMAGPAGSGRSRGRPARRGAARPGVRRAYQASYSDEVARARRSDGRCWPRSGRAAARRPAPSAPATRR